LKRKNTPKKIHFFHYLLILAGCLLLAGCSTTKKPAPESTDYLVIPLTSGKVSPISAISYDLLNTAVTIQLYDSTDYDLLNECFSVIDRYEKIFSRTLETSEVYKINHSNETTFLISDELKELLTLSLSYCEQSGGMFDVSVAPLTSLWDFSDASHHATVPSKDSVQEALKLVDYSAIHLEGNTLTFSKPGIQLEFGAVAKGFIADKVKEFLLANGVSSAIINLGGNVLLVGGKPDDTSFKIGIQKPFAERDSVLVAVTELKDVSMVSSGIYERYFYDESGAFFHHILDPYTGYPADPGLLQVTIISPTSAMGDALSTACFALGLEKGMELVHSLPDVYAVFITSDGNLHFSDGYLEQLPTTLE